MKKTGFVGLFIVTLLALGWLYLRIYPEAIVVNKLSALMSATAQPQIKEGESSLNIQWSAQAALLSSADFGITASAQLFHIYQVGTLKQAPFVGRRLLLIERECNAPCQTKHYRVIDDRDKEGLIFLQNVSNKMLEEDAKLFKVNDYYTVDELRLPDDISFEWESIFLRFKADAISPAVLFSQYEKENKGLDGRLAHAQYGTLYEDTKRGSFVLKLPDGTIKLYHLAFPFPMYSNQLVGPFLEFADLDLNLTGGETFSAPYTPYRQDICPPLAYRLSRTTGVLRKGGTIGPTLEFFEPASDEDPVYAEQGIDMKDPTVKSEHPIIFWKDALGRWVRMTNMQFYQSEIELPCRRAASIL